MPTNQIHPYEYEDSGWRPSCILRLGYTRKQLEAYIIKVEIVDGKDTDLHMDKPVYAIHLADVKEVENDRQRNH